MTRIGLACLAAVLVAAALAAPAGAKPIRMTHTVSIKGELVNHWTYDDPEPCGLVGGGTVTVTFETTVRVPVLPYVDRHIGAWVVTVRIGANLDHLTGVGDIPAAGTITRVDNTTRRPQDPDRTDPCPPLEKSGCGTVALRTGRRGAVGNIDRVDKRRISVSLGSEYFHYPRVGRCSAGQLEFWSDHRFTGPAADGSLPVTMPTPSALKRRRVTRATGTSHRRTAFSDPGEESMSNDVTRTATVTFRRR